MSLPDHQRAEVAPVLVVGPGREFAHFLRLRWGKVVDDLILEDSQRWARACERLVAAGVAEAAEPPMLGLA